MIVFEHAMRDWSDWVRECPVPVDIIQGAHDPVAAAEVVQSFAEAFPDTLTLHLLADAGYMVMLSHTGFVVERLVAAARS
jgi:pimeloyl-ACP methyl ester carboxylesterase